MSAIRLARAATGRETLVKFAGAYHGHVDGLLAEAGSGLATQGIPSSPGRARARPRAATVIVPVERPRRRPRRRFARARRRRAARRALPGEHGPRPARARLPRAAARARDRARRAARLRRGHHRLPRLRGRRAGADSASCPTSRSWARSSAAGSPRRRTAAPRELMRPDRARRRRLPGGHAERQPARRRRRPRHARAARRGRLRRSSPRRPRRSPTACARRRGDRPVQVAWAPGPAHRLLHRRRPSATTPAPPPATPTALRRLVPGAARTRRLPAAVAVRGLVPVARAHARARDPHAGGGRGRLRGDRMSEQRARPAGRRRSAPTAG